MRGLATVFRREVYERRLLALIALLGLVPIALPWLGGSWADLADARGAVALALAVVASAVLALLLGATVLAPELAERRLGFYFNRPIGAWAIWAGKLGAALALSLAAALAVVAPSALIGERPSLAAVSVPLFGFPLSASAKLALLLLLLLALVLAGHALSVMARARSPWLALDLAGAGVAGGLAWAALGRLFDAGALGPYTYVLLALPLLLVLALGAASAAQVSLARNDLRRAHRVLSIWLAGLLVAAGIAAAGYSRWVLAASPADLEQVEAVAAAPAGDWVALGGTVARRGGYKTAFVVDARTGRFARTGPGSFTYFQTPLFSADGRRAVWLETELPFMPSPAEVRYLDLDRPGARPVRTEIGFRSLPVLALSPDGRHIAAIAQGRLLVHELASGKLSASVPLPEPADFRQVRFVAPGRVRVYTQSFAWEAAERADSRPAPVTAIAEVDLATQRLERTGELAGYFEPPGLFSPDGERLIYLDGRTSGLRLADARTGRPLAELRQAGWTAQQGSPVFLADGRLALPARGLQGPEVRLLGRDGALLASFPFPGAQRLRLGGEARPGSLAVTVVNDERRPESTELRLLDVTSGASRTVARGLVPVGAGLDPLGPVPTRLFERPGDGLVWLDPVTGRQRVVAPGVR